MDGAKHSWLWAAAIAATLLAAGTVMRAADAQGTTGVATTDRPATIRIEPPSRAADTLIDIGVRAFKPPSTGTVDVIVTLMGPSGVEQEVGRFGIFPVEPFSAKNAREERTFRLDATTALAALKGEKGPLTVKVQLVPIGPGARTTGAQLTVGDVKFSPRL